MSSTATATATPIQEVEDLLKRLQSNKHVQSVIILNEKGQTIKSTLDDVPTKKYSEIINKMVNQTRGHIADIEEGNELTFLRVRTKKYEIIVHPENGYILVVFQNPDKPLTAPPAEKSTSKPPATT
ncbi:9491_t:CDS:2 [Paraglomus brasilianum]|uniref:9491_t:CDS:1 n=1 Tax=Paraglomus brasilianum TaxID=144538 RepID=A0A9N9FRB1_9GLOM|nr:9491_t:CDS:2 [Paraglomus brasilianum]